MCCFRQCGFDVVDLGLELELRGMHSDNSGEEGGGGDEDDVVKDLPSLCRDPTAERGDRLRRIRCLVSRGRVSGGGSGDNAEDEFNFADKWIFSSSFPMVEFSS